MRRILSISLLGRRLVHSEIAHFTAGDRTPDRDHIGGSSVLVAVDEIRRGEVSYYVLREDGDIEDVCVVDRGDGRPYLRAAYRGTWTRSLLELPVDHVDVATWGRLEG